MASFAYENQNVPKCCSCGIQTSCTIQFFFSIFLSLSGTYEKSTT